MIFRNLHIAWKSFWITIGVFAGLVALTALIGVSALQYPWVQAKVLHWSLNEVNQRIAGRLEVDELKGRIPLNTYINGIRLYENKTDSAQLMAEIQQIHGLVRFRDLLQSRPNIAKIEVVKPRVFIDLPSDESTIPIIQALQTLPDTSRSSAREPSPFHSIYLPRIKIDSAYVEVRNLKSQQFLLRDTLTLSNIVLDAVLELDANYIFVELETFKTTSNQYKVGNIDLSGQLYLDKESIELNGARLISGASNAAFSYSMDGIDPTKSKWTDRWQAATFSIKLDTSSVYLPDFAELIPGVPQRLAPLNMKLESSGDAKKIVIQPSTVGIAQSRFDFQGEIQAPLSEAMVFDLLVDKLTFDNEEARYWFPQLNWLENLPLSAFSTSGTLKGTATTANLNTSMITPGGDIKLGVDIERGLDAVTYNGSLITKAFDLSALNPDLFPVSSLNVDMVFFGSGLDKQSAMASLDADLRLSEVAGYKLNRTRFSLSYVNEFVEPVLYVDTPDGQFSISGWLDLASTELMYSFTGSGRNINLKNLSRKEAFPATAMDFRYELSAQGISLERIYGKFNVDILRARVNGDELTPHQLYMDLDSPDEENRLFRLTSSVLDMTVSGGIQTQKITGMFNQWADYFKDRWDEEIRFNRTEPSVIHIDLISAERSDGEIELDVELNLKRPDLIQAYLPNLVFKTQIEAQANIKASEDRLLLTGSVQDPLFSVSNIYLSRPKVLFTGSFRNQSTLKEFATADISLTADSISIPGYRLGRVNLVSSMRDDSISTSLSLSGIGQGASLNSNTLMTMREDHLEISLQQFGLGFRNYQWINSGTPKVRIENDVLEFTQFTFVNDDQSIQVDGRLSDESEDVMSYKLDRINLNRISDLLGRSLTFQGMLNAEFTTSTLNVAPNIQGTVSAERLMVNNRPLGDGYLTSVYDPLTRKFNTNLEIRADSVKYRNYSRVNNGVLSNAIVKGFFSNPEPGTTADTLYHFDIDFRTIDMWVVQLFIPNVFTRIEGFGSGIGYINQVKDKFDYHADFDLRNTLAVPVFINPNLYLTGKITFNRAHGVLFDNVALQDDFRGRGSLNGDIFLDDFKPNKLYNITLDMQNLKFLANKYAPDSPFYGDVWGTGQIRLTGKASSPFLQTTSPISTTGNSRLSIPLMDISQIESSSKFIEFISDFNDRFKKDATSTTGTAGAQVKQKSLTFAELFQMDLRFITSENTVVDLVFDPVTGEILTARGGGAINISLEDQELRMIGQFDILGGDYLFVGGDLFSRKFMLQEGGVINWEGSPQNPRVNLTASYRARPNLMPITSEDRRIPVDLVLKLTGSINSLQNEFYFDFPTTFESGQRNAALSILNSEDQKLEQATSLLLTGNFFRVNAGAEGSNDSFGGNLQTSATQAGISQLLSSQINNLLNSSISNLDIDLNMTGFDQADLGIALRLFDDRLVLRREGQIAGERSTIGDLGASYRINRNISVEVFHRQDASLTGLAGIQEQVESVNGVGLQYQVQFNTWRDFPKQVWRSIASLFRKEDEIRPASPLGAK